MHIFISNYDCNLPWGNDLNFNLYYLSMLPYNWYKPQNAFFFFGGFCRICIIIHWDLFCSVMGNKLIMGLDPSCKYGKRLGFELQYHPLNKGAFFICTCILLHEILIPHLMTSLSTKHSFLILGRQSSLSGVFKRL